MTAAAEDTATIERDDTARAAPVLAVDGLSISLWLDGRVVPVVTDVSFEVRSGEAVALVGESGCGKSMTARAIAGLPPTGAIVSGSIKLEGEEISTLPPRERRKLGGRRVGFIFQEPMSSLHPTLSLGAQMTDTIRTHLGLSRAAAREHAAELLDRVGIPRRRNALDAYVHELSGGMRQRAMIAMAISCNPTLLIADEPTTALDVTIQAQVLDLLADMRRELGVAMLYITHDLDVVADFCERAIILYAGDMVEGGRAADCLERPRHPYTRGLVDAIPSLDTKKTRLTAIPGTVPPLGAWPAGCRFAPRCSRVAEICRRRPALVREQNSFYRCWRPFSESAL
jgi:oligopeptide/dipeptide ABC transporter ATP-binding protein